MIMPNEPEATVPAMDVERRAAQLYGETTFIHPNSSTVQKAWLEASGLTKRRYRDRARSELAEEAKRRGDHDTLREMHGTIQTVTGAGNQGLDDLVFRPTKTEAVAKLIESVRELVLAVRAMDPTILDDATISDKVAQAISAVDLTASKFESDLKQLPPIRGV
jgi:hypothetical protein